MILYLNPAVGISGDMLLGALIGLGAPPDEVRTAITCSGLTGWRLDVEQVDRFGLRATRAVVTVADLPPERRARDLIAMAERAAPPEVAVQAVSCLKQIAEVEAAIHGVSPHDVHLHELGGDDTLIDVIGVAAALQLLGVTGVHSTPVALGNGAAPTAHGILPMPAPATAALLADAVVVGVDLTTETVTPTGAALLAMMKTSFAPVPVMTLRATA